MTPTLVPILSGEVRPTRFRSHSLAEALDRTLQRMAHRTAVRTSLGRVVTYGELGTAARALMQELEASGVRAGDVVAVRMPRSFQCIVAILATQLMNTTFATLDPLDPDHRMQQICARMKARVVLSRKDDGIIQIERTAVEEEPACPESNIAYIMHTSGSSGTPKGVPVSRPALLNLVDWYIDMLGFSEKSSISHLSRPSFDFSIPELFVPFLTGGRIDMPDTQLETQIVPTVKFLAESGTGIIQLVPTLLRRSLRAVALMPETAGSLRGLRYMVCNGEVLPDTLARRFYAVLPEATLINSYGPTECCVAVTYHVCPRDSASRPMFIGRPAPNTDVFVLDETERALGFDEEGELWLGGVQTASGYLANPSETNQHFRRFDTHRGLQLLYRTGDRVLCAREGGLRYLGRRDDQVKYRGVRLELGEIVNALEQTGLCTDAAALVMGDDEKQDLICFVTPADADVGSLSRRLAGSLPPALRPSRIIALAMLPATPNGKLDREALTQMARGLTKPDAAEPAAPVNEEDALRLRCLLTAVGRHVRAPVKGATRAKDCAIDSLSFLEIQLDLAADGFLFSEDVYRDQDVPLSSWAAKIQRLEDQVGMQKGSRGAVKARGRGGGALERELSGVVDAVRDGAPMTVTVHSSLAAFRNAEPARLSSLLIDMIRQLSHFATVLVPTFTPSFCATRSYDWKTSRSEAGILGDLVLRDLPAERTRHPVYSMAVIGPGGAELSQGEWWRKSPFGDDSIFGAVSRLGGFILNVGTPVATHVHRCEILADVPYMKTIELEGVADFGGGPLVARPAVYVRDVAGRPEYTDLARDVARDRRELKDLTRDFVLGGTYARLMDVREMEGRLVGAMRADPYGFLLQERRERVRKVYPMDSRGAAVNGRSGGSNGDADAGSG